jgi:IS30 family transposase
LKGYRPAQAQWLSDNRRATDAKSIKITDEVWGWIEQLIRQELSPHQVVDYLKIHKNLSLHHETLYQLIYADKEAGGDLYKHLRVVSNVRRSDYTTEKGATSKEIIQKNSRRT